MKQECHKYYLFIFRLESERDLKKALRCYREALADDPSTQPAKTRAEYIISVLEKKVCLALVMNKCSYHMCIM